MQSNITDHESAKIQGPHGVIQGYNGLAVADSENQVIGAANVAGAVYEGNLLPDMLDQVQATMQTISGKEEPLEHATVRATPVISARRIWKKRRNAMLLC